ncbi:MAG: trypsin-like serine protease [Oceanipulchritudo sp.]
MIRQQHQQPLFLLLASFAAASLSGVVLNDSAGLALSSSTAVTLLTQPGYGATGWVEIQEGTSRFRGTGVLLSNNWVLTAGHNWLGDAVTGLTFHHKGVAYTAQPGSWIQHPAWTADPGVGLGQGSDIGLFQLTTAIPGVAPASLYGGSSELGSTVTFLGAGSAGIGSEGPRLNPTPLYYAGTNVIDRVLEFDTGGGLLAFDFDDGSVQRNSLVGSAVFDVSGIAATLPSDVTLSAQSSSTALSALEATSAAGDSGAPAFANFGNGPELVGLVSWGVNPSEPSNLYGSTYGDITYLTRISSSRDWIMGIIPEPGITAFLFGLTVGLLTMCVRRFRRG